MECIHLPLAQASENTLGPDQVEGSYQTVVCGSPTALTHYRTSVTVRHLLLYHLFTCAN